jgi:hypothetical protein
MMSKEAMMNIDLDSFQDGAEVIWRVNPVARERYSSITALREWMIAETQCKDPDEVTSWGTLGFRVVFDDEGEGPCASVLLEPSTVVTLWRWKPHDPRLYVEGPAAP